MKSVATLVLILVLASAIGCNSESKRGSDLGGGGDKKCCPGAIKTEVGPAHDLRGGQNTPRLGMFQAKRQDCESKKSSGCCEAKEDGASGCCKGEKKDGGCSGKESKGPGGCELDDKPPQSGGVEKKGPGCGSEQPQSKAAGCGGGDGQAVVEGAVDTGDGQGRIEWMTNLSRALKVAAEEEKAVLVVFDADWCAPSRRMKRGALADSRVTEIANRLFVPVLLDADKHPEVADRYRVEVIPTTVVLAWDGTLVFRHEDAAGAAAYAALLEEADVAFMHYRELKRQADAEPEKVEPRLALARQLYRQGSFAAAAAEADRALAEAERKGCCGSKKFEAEIAVFAGECHAEARADAEALDRLAEKLEGFDRSGEHGFLDNALFFRAVASVVRDDPAEARSRLNRLVADHPGSDKAESAAIWMAWIELEKFQDRESAAQMLRRFIARYPESGYRELAERLLRRAAGRGQ